jgi:hypothetical protein
MSDGPKDLAELWGRGPWARPRRGRRNPGMTKTTHPDHLSLGALMIVLALTNVWFFTQVLGYVS